MCLVPYPSCFMREVGQQVLVMRFVWIVSCLRVFMVGDIVLGVLMCGCDTVPLQRVSGKVLPQYKARVGQGRCKV